MDVFSGIFSGVMGILRINFTIFGYTLNLWEVFCFTFVSSVIAFVVWEVLLGDR